MPRVQNIGALDHIAKRIASNSDENPYGTTNVTFQQDVDEYARTLATMDRQVRQTDTGLPSWQFERALLNTALYTSIDDDTYGNMMRRIAKDAPFTRLRKLTNEDNDEAYLLANGNSEKYYSSIQHAMRKGLNMFGGFSRHTYSFRRTDSDPFWQFRRFLRFNKGERYDVYSPTSKGGTIGDFPGPGVVFEKMDRPLFPKGRIESRFEPHSRLSFAEQKYRSLLIRSVVDIPNTKWGYFRGMQLISNPERAKINGEPYDLLILNDHLVNPTQRALYLVPNHMSERFFQDPLKDFGNNHLFNPKNLERYECVIDVISLAALGGYDKELPESIQRDLGIFQEIDEPRNMRNKCHNLHREIEDALLFYYAQYDLLNEASNLYNLGYFFDSHENTWMLDKHRLLREAVRWNTSNNNDPILFPYPVEVYEVRSKLVKEVGFLSNNLGLYRDNPSGDYFFFLDGKPDVGREGTPVKNWKQLLGKEGVDAWDRFHTSAVDSGAFMAFTDSKMKDVALGIIRGEK